VLQPGGGTATGLLVVMSLGALIFVPLAAVVTWFAVMVSRPPLTREELRRRQKARARARRQRQGSK
jgi:hypothetical protein